MEKYGLNTSSIKEPASLRDIKRLEEEHLTRVDTKSGCSPIKMLALMKYGDKAASTRQRLLQYREFLLHEGIETAFFPLLTNDYLERTFRGEAPPVLSVLKSYLSRLKLLLDVKRFDLIWVQYEGFPFMPGLVEKLMLISGKPIVYDFDDAIFHQYDAHRNSLVRRLLGAKLQPLIRGASLCVCGNAYLKAYADRFSSRTEIVPTVLDTDVYAPSARPCDAARPITIGWIGSPSTWNYVQPLLPLLRRLSHELNLIFRVVGAGRSITDDCRFEFVNWSEDEEVTSIQAMDVGIMPLPDEPWARGKCGYKLIQYMACGIPVIASPVGVNCEIVVEGVNGYLARDEPEWETAIRRLVGNAELRAAMGARGREKVVGEYSLRRHGPRLATLLRAVVESSAPSVQ